MSRLQGEVVLVAGASRAQGRAHARTARGSTRSCPGLVDTPMTNRPGAYDRMAGHPGGTRADFEASALHHGTLGGQGAPGPGAVADAAVWLASDGAHGVTGRAIPVDAGHLAPTGSTPAPVRP